MTLSVLCICMTACLKYLIIHYQCKFNPSNEVLTACTRIIYIHVYMCVCECVCVHLNDFFKNKPLKIQQSKIY